MARPTLLLLLANALLAACAQPREAPGVRIERRQGARVCTVTANGNKVNDVPNLRKAFSECNNGGTVVFPEGQVYWIGEVFNPVLTDVHIEWRGQWQVADTDLDYWRQNSEHVGYFNMVAGIIFTGERISIDGHGTGGIWGNGDTWFNAENGQTQWGRPQPFFWRNASDCDISNFYVRQSPIWSINMRFCKHMRFENITVNNVAANAPPGANWVANGDGFNMIDSEDIHLTNFEYRGGDDCIAVKERSFGIYIKNVTCHAGNGIAIGSLGAYEVDSSVGDIWISDVQGYGTNRAIYIKIWMGVPQPTEHWESESGFEGGGFGTVKNLHFDNVNATGCKEAFRLTQNHGSADTYWGTSKMYVEDVWFSNFYGKLRETDGDPVKPMPVNCSAVYPCNNINFAGITNVGATGVPIRGTCNNVTKGGVHGLPGCRDCIPRPLKLF